MASASEAKRTAESHDNTHPEARDPDSVGGRLRAVAGQNAQDARNIGERTAEAAARTADTVADVTRDMTQRVADQGREAVRLGLRAVAGAQAPLADVSYDRSRRLVETTARVTDIYHDAAQRTADDVQALVGSFTSLGRGLQQYQHAYLDVLNRSLESVSRKQQDLFRANSPVELAEVQRDIYLDAVNNMLTGSTMLLQIAGQIAQEAVKPLQERARAHGRG
jgi:hypothetical protein